MWSLLSTLLSGPLSSISRELKEAYQSKINAQNDLERIAAEERISLLEARKTIILKSQSDPIEKWVRILLALPFVIYINKLILWDKVLKLGVTDPLSAELSSIMWIILAGYFADATVRRFTNGRL